MELLLAISQERFVSLIRVLPLGCGSKLEQLQERPGRPYPGAGPAWPARILKQELFNT
jgi:hypothetical protein